MDYKMKRERVSIKTITGKRSQLCLIKLETGEITNHRHVQEQIGYVLSGRVDITIGEDTKTLGSGEGYYIPGNVPHGFSVNHDEPVEYIEIFCPPKKENVM